MTSGAAELPGPNDALGAAADPAWVRRWLPWVCLGLLVLPFHTLWIDFEQVRRGLLLLLTGTALIALPKLPHVRGERVALGFLAALVLCAIVQVLVQNAFHQDGTPWSFQPWDAAYRIAHWFALLVIVRIGVMLDVAALATTVATLTLATSLFGMLQRLGIAEIHGYGVEREPVSTLGNLNVASEWTAIAGITTAVLRPKIKASRRWLPILALAAACAYLILNPSRSGKIAMFCGLVLLAIMRRKQHDYAPLVIAAAGSLLGFLIPLAAPMPQLSEQAMKKELERGTVTLDIRFEIGNGATKLFSESLVFGKGPGQFAVEYPRYRSQKEIEASSFERQFDTEVRTAHDDWLELLVDGGLVALVFFAAMLFALQRGTRDKTRLVPMFVLLLLMLVRAPLGNAPAAALAFMLVGSPVALPAKPWLRRLNLGFWIAVGIAMVVLGTLPIAGNTAFVPYVRAARDGTPKPSEAASNAIAWMCFEPRWYEVQARDRLRQGDLKSAATLAAQALQLRPFSPPLLLLLAEVLAQGNRYGEALKVAEQGLQLDPANPELRVLRSTAFAELGDVDRAIEAVVIDPHPVLRTNLETHFFALAERATKRGERKQATRYTIEHTFLALSDLLATGSQDVLPEVQAMNGTLDELVKGLDRANVDTRYPVTMALEALARGRAGLASKYAEVAKLRGKPIEPWQAALLGKALDRLRELPGWADVLPAK